MNFSTNEDIAMPLDGAFAQVADFESFERLLQRRGLQVSRVSPPDVTGAGMRWAALARIRGRAREIDITLSHFEPPTAMHFKGQSEAFDFAFHVDLLALSRQRTRMRVNLDIRPRHLSARLLLQSARLARGKLLRRYKERVAGFARDIETRSG